MTKKLSRNLKETLKTTGAGETEGREWKCRGGAGAAVGGQE